MPPSPNAAAEAEEEEEAAAAAAEGTRSPGGAVMPPATAASQGFATSPMTASPARSHPPNTPGAMSHVSATPGMAMRSPYGTEATTSEAGDLVDRMPFSPSIDGVSPSGRRSEPRPRGGGGRWSRDPNLFTPPQGMMGGAMGEGDQFGESDVDPTQSQGSAQYAADDPTATFGAQNSTMVWGTTISLHEAMTNAKHFLRDYVAPSDGGTAPGEPLYPQLLRQSKEDNSYNLNIDAHHLRSFDDEHGYHLYRDLVRYPQEMVPIFDLCVYEEFHRLYGEEADEQKRFQVRVFNLDQVKAMRDLNPKDIDTLVSVQGMVVRASAIQPDLKQAFFECSACGMSVTVSIDRGRINEPQACTSCDAKYSYVLKHNRCLFTDKQVVKMQETPESMPEGETPATITVCAYDDLVDHGKPGDRAVITGVYRAVPMRINPRKRNVMTVFRTYIDVIHYQKNTRSRFAAEDARQSRDSEFHTSVEERATLEDQIAQEEAEMRAIGGDPKIYDNLVQSLAPSIWELNDVKKGILCQLFGGTNNKTSSDPSKNMVNTRGELNVVLVGDPGTAKSQLLNYVHKIAPRGIYTSGQGSSAVGLTAFVTKDPDTGDNVLESGALVLSDRGICCIDEFDKMTDLTRAVLHEVMEQQTVSVAKAGIICSLNARTSVLAAANPIESRYNPKKSVVENINLPPTLLSRFDLIYLVLDKPDENSDGRLAAHLVQLYFKDAETSHKAKGVYDVSTLTRYISYARKNCHPRLTAEASTVLVKQYVDMRQQGVRNKTVTSTPRQLESLIRLSEAHARMRLSQTVELGDVNEAVRLMMAATMTAATNPETGEIDMDLITTGRSANDRQRLDALASELRGLIDDRRGDSFAVYEVAAELRERSQIDVSNDDVRAALDILVHENHLNAGSAGGYRRKRGIR